jgi:hypothetical protein
VIANGCLRKEARREHLDYINKGLLSKPDRGAKLALAHCDRLILKLSEVLSVKEVEGSYMQPN